MANAEAGRRTYFFCGIGGIGMSALAQLLVARGDQVIGSDRGSGPTTELLHAKGVQVYVGQRVENLPDQCDALVYSDAVPEDNPERAEAVRRGIPQYSYFALLGQVSRAYQTVAVAGTHGKTTTTSMLARILVDAGADPTAIIGSIVADFGSNYREGASDLFVVEACEYRDHLLELSPEILVVTNLEWDHTDYFPSLAAMQETFRAAMRRIPTGGVVITNPHDPAIAPLLGDVAARVVDYTAEPPYELRLPGGFNQDNARAAAAAARVVLPRIDTAAISASLSDFRGTWRRFEYKGTFGEDVVVYDDYAHHPTAVAATLTALREKLHTEARAGRIIAVFHPHLFSRTRDLLPDFSAAFGAADEVLLAPIYAAREQDDGTVSSEILAAHIRATGTPAEAFDSLTAIEAAIRERAKGGDTVITMGAGDIYTVADALVASPTSI